MNVIPVDDALLHSCWLAIVLTPGVGLTVILNTLDVLLQPLADGVTVIFATDGLLPVFVAVKDAILPVPVAARPMAAILFVQP